MLKNATTRPIIILAVLLMMSAAYSVRASAAQLKINLVLDGGIVLIYHGKEAGITEGQTLTVTRAGKSIGTIEVTKVTDVYVQGKIVSGEDVIADGDEITIGATKSAAKAEKTGKEKKKDTKKASKKSSRKSSKKSGDDKKKKVSSKDKKKSTGKSKRGSSRRSKAKSKESAKSDDDSAVKSEKDGEKTSKKKSRRGRSSRSKKKTDDSKDDKAAKKADGSDKKKDQIEPVVLKERPHYSLHLGYFYLNNSDVPGSVIGESPSPVVSFDYWIPKKKNKNLYYSLLYSRPKVNTYYGGQNVSYQLRMIQFMAGLVWDDLSTSFGNDVYAGLAAGWRSASYEMHCSVSCDGISESKKKSQEGVDYHGILGVKFKKKSELKFLYSFDEQYYTIDVGFRY